MAERQPSLDKIRLVLGAELGFSEPDVQEVRNATPRTKRGPFEPDTDPMLSLDDAKPLHQNTTHDLRPC